MKKNHNKRIEAESAFAAEIYRDRAAVNRKAQQILASGSRQITIRLGNDELARARRQAEAKGLKYQTYIKMLLHEALARNSPADDTPAFGQPRVAWRDVSQCVYDTCSAGAFCRRGADGSQFQRPDRVSPRSAAAVQPRTAGTPRAESWICRVRRTAGSLGPFQVALFHNGVDLVHQLRFDQMLIRIRNTDILEHIPAPAVVAFLLMAFPLSPSAPLRTLQREHRAERSSRLSLTTSHSGPKARHGFTTHRRLT